MWLARLLLILYPPAFRRRYGAELTAVLAEDLAAARRLGLASRMRCWKNLATDVVLAGARLRARQLSTGIRDLSGRGSPRPPVTTGRSPMDTLLQDLRDALRQLVRRPGFTAVAVLSLGLAIGGNSLIYGMLDGFVFRPFAYPEPDRLVSVGVTFPKLSSETSYIEALSPAEYHDIRTTRTFSQAAAFDLGNRNISGGDVPERVFTALLLDDLFPVMGMPPALGRGFTKEELSPNGPRVAIISHRLWQSRFGGDPAILRSAIRIDGQAATVVGVMPPGLVLVGTDLWIPWGGDRARIPRNLRQFTILARLAPGASLERANAELDLIARRTEQSEGATFAEYEGWRLTATPWAAALLQDVRPAAYLLLGAVALVLLIACANLTNLFLARATTRHRELAVRLALGASRWRITRHLLTESLVLSFGGAAAGLLIAAYGLRVAPALIPGQFQMLGLEAGLNARVLWWSAALAAVSGLLVALVPAFQATRTDPHDSLKADGRGGGGRGGRMRQGLVVAEIALSVVLLLGAGLLMRTVHNIHRVDPGFDATGVVTMRLTLPRDRYPGEAAGAFFESLIERLAAVPGVRAVSAASQFPPLGTFDTQFRLERATDTSSTLPAALITVASPGHFETLGVPLTAGRAFTTTDRLDTDPVAVVNEAFAARYLPGQEAVGQRVAIGSPDRQRPWTTIVGVVGDFRNSGATRPVRPEIFMPIRQQLLWNQLFVLVRSDLSAASAVPAVRQAVASLDPEQPIYAIQTLEEAIALSVFQQRISAMLLGIFAAVALVLAAGGIYGVMSYSVSARTQEIGVRLAIGAHPRNVVWLVLRQILVLSLIGLGIGIAVLVAAGRGLEGLLYGVRAADPVTITATGLLLLIVAMLAAWVPAARAARIDPIDALRYE